MQTFYPYKTYQKEIFEKNINNGFLKEKNSITKKY